MSDINLLPGNLREKEQTEQAKKIPAPAPKYTKSPSLLGERIMEAEKVQGSWWETVLSWFNRVPTPEKTTNIKQDAQVTIEIEEDKPSFFKKLFTPKDATPAVPMPKSAPASVSQIQPQNSQAPKVVKAPIPSVPIGVVLDVNLLPVSSQPSPVKPYLKKLGYVALAAVIFVGIIYGILLSFVSRQKVQSEVVKNDAKQLIQLIKKSEQDLRELEAATRQMETVKKIITNNNDYLRMMDVFEKATLPEISLSAFSSSADGLVTVTATGRTVTDIARQLAAFENYSAIQTVAIGSISVGTTDASVSEVSTSFQIQLTPNYLKDTK